MTCIYKKLVCIKNESSCTSFKGGGYLAICLPPCRIKGGSVPRYLPPPRSDTHDKHVRALENQEGIDISPTFQTKLLVSFVNAFLVVRFHLCEATSIGC